jgi:dienelactone hydrolase
MLTIPKGAKPDQPLPVVIFGHGLVCEHRFVLGVADGLAKQGFAVIGIDFPYHGTRSSCAWNGPVCFPDPMSKDGEMLCPDPCPSDSTCSADGKCRDASGADVGLSVFPVVNMAQASGAAFIELDSIAGTMSHFSQAVTDLGALSRVVRKAQWSSHIGYSFETDGIYYLGQSLGGIIGATYVPLDPYVKRAVLNVPGANLVPMFVDSLYFGSHVDAFLEREKIVKGTPAHQRFLNIARWFMDPVDPINVARYLQNEPLPNQAKTTNDREVLIQMATLDFIIPNTSTKHLASVSKVTRIDYVAEHGFLIVPVEPAYLAGSQDARDFLAGSLKP